MRPLPPIREVRGARLTIRGNLLVICLLLSSLAFAGEQTAPTSATDVCPSCIRHNLEYLAGPALHGRGSGTTDEYHAAKFIAAQLKHYGLAPSAGNGSYIQTGTLMTRTITSPPVVSFTGPDGKSVSWKHGEQLAFFRCSQPALSAPLQKLDLNDPNVSPSSVKPGAAVVLKQKAGTAAEGIESTITAYLGSKASLVILPQPAGGEGLFHQVSSRLPRPERKLGNEPPRPDGVILKPEEAQQLWAMPEGTVITVRASVTPWRVSHTWNVLAKIEGKDQPDQIVLLSAHLDHLGMKNGKVYPGADDDASGTVAVMELARALAKQPQPERTIVFALWGSEEAGLVGARYFLQNPTFDLKNIIANLEFEMIARADPKVKPDQLWLTGWERTNLGPELATHGAALVGDPHPDQGFFTRSDNFALAKDGIVAQTVSSYGLHKDYHQPTDSLDKVDWQHLYRAIGSMIAPINWLANSSFTPQWNEGQRP
ncbi:MAG TPA: M20/M25/M40 family metallo-hydrolase [Terriglobales bacterium]|nr:M20/M25/M40 family metallo-hydrolase [Terriglobales bacterium]